MQHYGSDGKHCLGPRQLLFGSDEGSETPNSAPLKSKEGSVISQMDSRSYLKRELLDTEGQASIAAGRVGVLELGDLWHRIFWQLTLQLSDSLEFLLKSSWSSLRFIIDTNFFCVLPRDILSSGFWKDSWSPTERLQTQDLWQPWNGNIKLFTVIQTIWCNLYSMTKAKSLGTPKKVISKIWFETLASQKYIQFSLFHCPTHRITINYRWKLEFHYIESFIKVYQIYSWIISESKMVVKVEAEPAEVTASDFLNINLAVSPPATSIYFF